MSLSTGQILENRYRIAAPLGQGGMGAVYQATDLRFNATVAIKENRMVTDESQKQFAREAGLLYRLRHPNLPRVIDHFSIPNQGQYLVMDYVEGQDLKQVVARYGPVPQAQALKWMSQVLEALEYLHNVNIILEVLGMWLSVTIAYLLTLSVVYDDYFDPGAVFLGSLVIFWLPSALVGALILWLARRRALRKQRLAMQPPTEHKDTHAP